MAEANTQGNGVGLLTDTMCPWDGGRAFADGLKGKQTGAWRTEAECAE